MDTYYIGLALFLLATLGAGLLRVQRGPTAGDRMVASMLFGTTGVAVLLVLSEYSERPALVNVALVFSLLAAINTIAFARQGWGGFGSDGSGQ